MALLETLLTSVAPSIGEYIVKIWLGDSDIAKNTELRLKQLIALKTDDVSAQRRGRRQLEEIGDKVAASLQPLFEEAGLEENQQVAVADALAVTLRETPLTPEFLIRHNLDPTELATYLLNVQPQATRLFSAAEIALYQRVVNEAAENIVDIAAQLPGFQERTFAEILVVSLTNVYRHKKKPKVKFEVYS